MSTESLSHFLELAAKYAWAVFVAVGIVLFVPESIVKQVGLYTFRSENLGYMWLIFLFSGVLALGSLSKVAAWRFFLCPAKKLLFPVVDARTRLKQSRMRYYLGQFAAEECNALISFQEVDSNGNVRRYVLEDGRPYFAPKSNTWSHIRNKQGDSEFQHPRWQRIDWKDVFGGDVASGCWGISDR